MASKATEVKTATQDCFRQIFGAASCTGTCIYKWDANTGQYNLQSGSSCSGGTGCHSCPLTHTGVVYGLALLLGKGCFPDPDVISYNCGVDLEAAAILAVRAIKLHQLLVKLVIGLGIVSVLSIAGTGYMFFFR